MNQDPPIRTDSQGSGTACGLIRHLLVMLYDGVIIVAILMLAGALALALPFSNPTAGKDAVYSIYLLCFWFLYLAVCWRLGGATLGMRAWRVQLVSDTGPVPGWKQCFVRFTASWLSAACAGAGFLWVLLDTEHLSWHDRLSKTRLLYLGRRKSDGAA